jgi:flagellar motility protein MotE (MotC chaperone)
MTKILQNPALLSIVALFAGIAAGVVPLMRVGDQIIAQIRATRVAVAKEKKAQGWDFWTVEIDNLASELRDEKSRQRKKADLLEQRSARLDSEQQELDKIRANVESMEKEIGQRVIEIRADEAKNLRSLAQTYTNLSPGAAVAILKEMDDNTVVKILSLMKPDVIALIFEEMSKTSDKDGPLARRAAILSEKIRLLKATKTANNS